MAAADATVVLATGNPALTQGMADRLTHYSEALLDSRQRNDRRRSTS